MRKSEMLDASRDEFTLAMKDVGAFLNEHLDDGSTMTARRLLERVVVTARAYQQRLDEA